MTGKILAFSRTVQRPSLPASTLSGTEAGCGRWGDAEKRPKTISLEQCATNSGTQRQTTVWWELHGVPVQEVTFETWRAAKLVNGVPPPHTPTPFNCLNFICDSTHTCSFFCDACFSFGTPPVCRHGGSVSPAPYTTGSCTRGPLFWSQYLHLQPYLVNNQNIFHHTAKYNQTLR